MRAAVCRRYGPPEVLRLAELPVPVPRPREVCIRVRAAAVTSSDCYLRGLDLPLRYRAVARVVMGMRGPRVRVLGLVAAGQIASVGGQVTRFRVGERVYAFTGTRFGCHAEYVCVASDGVIAPAPVNASDVEAAAVPYGGLLAMHFLRRANVRSGQRVMIYGASGAVGTAAVQLATHLGAAVTGVCGPTNLELVRRLGAVEVMDYTTSDIAGRGPAFDVVLDAVGKTSRSKVAGALAPAGRFISVNGGTPKFTAVHLAELTRLYEIGVLEPVIDRVYPLAEIIDSHRYVETGHKRGNVLVTLD